MCFRAGRKHLISNLVQHKIDRILIAATKVDYLHHVNHQNLEKITGEIVDAALAQAKINGVLTDTVALASLRSTKEGTSEKNGESLPVVIGTPMKGEKIGDTVFDGKTETAIFPGDLPRSLSELLSEGWQDRLQFVRFLPPELRVNEPFPHIRLDRAMEFLFGDYLL